jgi:hypothetical protein
MTSMIRRRYPEAEVLLLRRALADLFATCNSLRDELDDLAELEAECSPTIVAGVVTQSASLASPEDYRAALNQAAERSYGAFLLVRDEAGLMLCEDAAEDRDRIRMESDTGEIAAFRRR